MRQILLACLCFTFFTVNAQAQKVNSTDLLKQLLDLPAPPPVDESTPRPAAGTVVRAPDFFEKDKIPPDDAPLEDLIEYWSAQSRNYSPLRYKIKPSEKSLARILEFCEETPEAVSLFLNILPANPETAETVKRIYDKFTDAKTVDYNAERIRNWLVYNSNLYVDELVKKAEKVKDKDEYVTNQADLLALARVDWDKALPILERLADDKTQPVSAALANWAFYARAMTAGDDPDISKYRRQLQDIVEDRRSSAGARDLAFDALVSEKEWDGRDEWYLSLLSDETLFDLKVNGRSYTGLTTLILYSPPEKYVGMMATLVESKNPAVRRAAIKNLTTYLQSGNIEAVRALLPWASNPNWAGDYKEGRSALIAALGKVDLPESVPALINILMTEEEHRQTAAEALAGYKDPRAVPALRMALGNEKLAYRRMIFIRALDACGGFGDDEKMAALELFAAAVSTPEGAAEYYNALYGGYNDDTPNVTVVLNIGNYVANETDPGDGLVTRAVARLKTLRKTKPAVAAALAAFMQKWRGRVIFIERLRQIRGGEADLDTVLTALAQRAEIREKVESEIFAMRAGGGIGRGISACLTEDAADLLSALRLPDADAQIALFGCARLLRAKLPVAEVGALLKSANKPLALAAERYLEVEDSVASRTIILELRAGEAVILGARQAFVPDPKNSAVSEPLRQIFQSITGRGYAGETFSVMDKNETALRNEIRSNPDLLAIYGILPNSLEGQQVIRVFKDRIVFTNYEDTARYRERVLTAKEYEDFYRLVLEEKIDSAVPYYGYCDSGCEANEFVMFGKNGGRRVFFLKALLEHSPVKKIFERIASFNEGDLKLHYRLADKIKGLEVLLADDNLPALAVWKNGDDLRVLVADRDRKAEIEKNLAAEFEVENKVEIDEENYALLQQRRESQQKRYRESRTAHFFWRGVENGSPGAILPQPPEMPYLYDETQFPETEGFNPEPRAWKVRAGLYEIRASGRYSEEAGLFKVSRSQPPVKFKEGNYDSPLVSGDGKWAVVTKAAADWSEPLGLVRVNLQTGREFPVDLPPADTFSAIAFVASPNKVLIRRARRINNYNYPQNRNYAEDEEETEVKPVVSSKKDDQNPSPPTPEYYLLDAATGATQPVKGEFRPLEDLTYRPLQATGAPDEFWAAVYDKKAKETAIGRYNTKTFTFQTVTKLPEIKLSSMDIRVDEKEAKVYFVYEGHLLSAPLPGQQK